MHRNSPLLPRFQMTLADFTISSQFWHRGQCWRVTATDEHGVYANAVDEDAERESEWAYLGPQVLGRCTTAHVLVGGAALGPWRYLMSPFGIEAVISGPTGEFAHLSRTKPLVEVGDALVEEHPFEAAVHLMANAPSYRQALTAARDALAAGGPDAREQALSILNRALEA